MIGDLNTCIKICLKKGVDETALIMCYFNVIQIYLKGVDIHFTSSMFGYMLVFDGKHSRIPALIRNGAFFISSRNLSCPQF